MIIAGVDTTHFYEKLLTNPTQHADQMGKNNTMTNICMRTLHLLHFVFTYKTYSPRIAEVTGFRRAILLPGNRGRKHFP